MGEHMCGGVCVCLNGYDFSHGDGINVLREAVGDSKSVNDITQW